MKLILKNGENGMSFPSSTIRQIIIYWYASPDLRELYPYIPQNYVLQIDGPLDEFTPEFIKEINANNMKNSGFRLFAIGDTFKVYNYIDGAVGVERTLDKNYNMVAADDLNVNASSVGESFGICGLDEEANVDLNNLSIDALDVTTVNLNYNNVEDGLSVLQTDIATNTNDIATNASGIATNTNNIATNASDIATNTNDIATNASGIATNTNNIATNASGIATNTNDIATNASGIATNTNDIATNASGIATLQTQKANLSGAVFTGVTQGLDPVNSNDFATKNYVDDNASPNIDTILTTNGDLLYKNFSSNLDRLPAPTEGNCILGYTDPTAYPPPFQKPVYVKIKRPFSFQLERNASYTNTSIGGAFGNGADNGLWVAPLSGNFEMFSSACSNDDGSNINLLNSTATLSVVKNNVDLFDISFTNQSSNYALLGDNLTFSAGDRIQIRLKSGSFNGTVTVFVWGSFNQSYLQTKEA